MKPGCRLALRIVPNAKRSELAGTHGAAIRVKIAAPAVEGRSGSWAIRDAITMKELCPPFYSEQRGNAHKSLRCKSNQRIR